MFINEHDYLLSKPIVATIFYNVKQKRVQVMRGLWLLKMWLDGEGLILSRFAPWKRSSRMDKSLSVVFVSMPLAEPYCKSEDRLWSLKELRFAQTGDFILALPGTTPPEYACPGMTHLRFLHPNAETLTRTCILAAELHGRHQTTGLQSSTVNTIAISFKVNMLWVIVFLLFYTMINI